MEFLHLIAALVIGGLIVVNGALIICVLHQRALTATYRQTLTQALITIRQAARALKQREYSKDIDNGQ